MHLPSVDDTKKLDTYVSQLRCVLWVYKMKKEMVFVVLHSWQGNYYAREFRLFFRKFTRLRNVKKSIFHRIHEKLYFIFKMKRVKYDQQTINGVSVPKCVLLLLKIKLNYYFLNELKAIINKCNFYRKSR